MATSLHLHNQSLSKLTGVIEKINLIQKTMQGLQGPTDSLSASDLPDRFSYQPSKEISFTDQGQGTTVPYSTESDLVSRANAILPGSRTQSHWFTPGMEKCASWCSCRCHSKTTIVVPRFLRSVIGKTVVEYAGNQATCNEHSCRGSRKSGLELSYCVPKYLSRQYIFVKMSRAPLGNPTVTLRMPRTMDWTHLLWKYAPRGDLAAVQSLFKSAKAAPDDTNFQGGTALLLASAYPKLYQFLIQAGADLNVSDMHGRKPVNLIGERLLSGRIPDGDVESTEALLAETDFMESRQFSTVHKSVLRLSERILADELQETTSSLNAADSEGRTPLIWATMRDDLTTMSILLGFGADPNVRDYAGNASLHYVRSTDACNALIKAGGNVHTRNRTRRRTCVHHACKNTDNPELIQLLHENGADIDVRDVDAETPLFHAVSYNFTSTAKELINLGTDVNAVNVSSKDSVLHIAVAFDHCEIIPKLLQQGADYTFTNRHGKTIAHKAAAWGTRYTVELLSKLDLSKIDLTVKDTNGKTASDHIAEREVLLESEAGIHDSFAQFMRIIKEAKRKKEMGSQEPSKDVTRKSTDTDDPPIQLPSHRENSIFDDWTIDT